MTTKAAPERIAQICDRCPSKERCCAFYTDAALRCTCTKCGQYIGWQPPSRVGTPRCDACQEAAK